MNISYLISTNSYYYIYKDHFTRWVQTYRNISRDILRKEIFENAKFIKYESIKRLEVFQFNYEDSYCDYYDYIEKTLLEERTQKKSWKLK